MFHNFLAFYTLTYILALVAGVLFECPCISLVKMLLEPRVSFPIKKNLEQINDTSTTKLFAGAKNILQPIEIPCLYLKKSSLEDTFN